MKNWETATLKYIHHCLVKLSHYKIRGTINYPPAHLTALIEEYRIEDLLIALWGSTIISLESRRQLIKAYCLLLRHTASLADYGSIPETFYAFAVFQPVRKEVVKAILALEKDLVGNQISIELLAETQVQKYA